MAPSVLAALCVVAALPTVTVSGTRARPEVLDRAALERLGASEWTWTVHDHVRRVRGVRLDAVLTAAGFTSGRSGPDVAPAQKQLGFRKVVVATARDGFQAVFSTAELTRGMGRTEAVLIWELDGAPLGDDDGPFRIVVLTDGAPSRAIRQLARIDVVEPPPPSSASEALGEGRPDAGVRPIR